MEDVLYPTSYALAVAVSSPGRLRRMRSLTMGSPQCQRRFRRTGAAGIPHFSDSSVTRNVTEITNGNAGAPACNVHISIAMSVRSEEASNPGRAADEAIVG